MTGWQQVMEDLPPVDFGQEEHRQETWTVVPGAHAAC